MSSKNIKRWITINGNHVPVYEDGTLGGVAEKFMAYDGTEHEWHAEKATGKTVSDLKDDLKKNYGLELDSADADDMQRSKSFNDEKVTMYDKDGNEYEGTYNKYSDGGREIVDIKKKETGQEGGLTDKEMRDKGYIVDYPLDMEDPIEYDRKRRERELADEADAYDREHKEGQYSEEQASSDKIKGNWNKAPEPEDKHDAALMKTMDSLQEKGKATTDNAEVASQYKLNDSFSVKDNGDGTYDISKKTADSRYLEARSFQGNQDVADKYNDYLSTHPAEYDAKGYRHEVSYNNGAYGNATIIDSVYKKEENGDRYVGTDHVGIRTDKDGNVDYMFNGDRYKNIDYLNKAGRGERVPVYTEQERSIKIGERARAAATKSKEEKEDNMIPWFVAENGQVVRRPREAIEKDLQSAQDSLERAHNISADPKVRASAKWGPDDFRRKKEEIAKLEGILERGTAIEENPSKSIKVGDKEVGVSKTKPTSSDSYNKANAAYKRSEARSQKAELARAEESGDYSGIFASTYNKMSLSEVKSIGRQLGLSDFALSGNKSEIIADILRVKRNKK